MVIQLNRFDAQRWGFKTRKTSQAFEMQMSEEYRFVALTCPACCVMLGVCHVMEPMFLSTTGELIFT